MKQTAQLLSVLILALLLVSGCGGQIDTDPAADSTSATFSELVLAISTRPDATLPADANVISAEAADAAQVFSDNLGNAGDKVLFAGRVAAALQNYALAYQLAGLTPLPAEGRAVAVDAFFAALMQAANQAGIDLEQLELALLSAGADLETRLAPQLATTALELFRTCWVGAAHNLYQRILFLRYPAALTALGVATSVTDTLNQTITVLEAGLVAELQSLEEAVHDPTVLADSALLIQQQFNLFAMNDLAGTKFFLALSLPVGTTELDLLVAQMKTFFGMSDMTLQTLLDSGIVSLDTGGQPQLPLADYLVYDWISPGMFLSYTPLPGLAAELSQLGEAVPTPPNFTPFLTPYLALFQLRYDAELSNQIIASLWDQAGDPNIPAPPTLQELFQLRQGEVLRREQALAGFSGATEAAKEAIGTLLFWPR
jgi:hypothetical protein